VSDTPRWRPGDAVALRYITRDGKPGMSWPYRVVADREDLVALYIPRGAVYKRWGADPATGQRVLVDGEWRRDVLRLMFPGEHHSVWLFWEHDGDGRRAFSSYYVNMEEPFRRTAIGFDTNDHMLDVVVTPDLRWSWKDEDVMADRVRQGVYPAEFADFVRAEGERVIADVERRASPFADGWETWEPDPGWAAPTLPERWDAIPATLWERRVWAYGDIAR
jgi:predicted RNA-binding protein associated with RNAse of E/G family